MGSGLYKVKVIDGNRFKAATAARDWLVANPHPVHTYAPPGSARWPGGDGDIFGVEADPIARARAAQARASASSGAGSWTDRASALRIGAIFAAGLAGIAYFQYVVAGIAKDSTRRDKQAQSAGNDGVRTGAGERNAAPSENPTTVRTTPHRRREKGAGSARCTKVYKQLAACINTTGIDRSVFRALKHAIPFTYVHIRVSRLRAEQAICSRS